MPSTAERVPVRFSTYMAMRSPRGVDVEPGAPSAYRVCGLTGTAIIRSRIVAAAAENLSSRLGAATGSTVTTPPTARSCSSRRLPFMFQDSAANRPALLPSGASGSPMSQMREAPVAGFGWGDVSVVRRPGRSRPGRRRSRSVTHRPSTPGASCGLGGAAQGVRRRHGRPVGRTAVPRRRSASRLPGQRRRPTRTSPLPGHSQVRCDTFTCTEETDLFLCVETDRFPTDGRPMTSDLRG